jgi:glycosyltransferase involved in cell wall biosynthesis
MPELPVVDVLMRVKNGEAFVVEALASLACQTYKNWRLWILDEHSKDDTLALIEHWIEGLQRDCGDGSKGVWLTGSPSHGMGAAYAKLFEGSGLGNYVAQLDADDILPVDALLRCVKACEEHKADVCTGAVSQFGDGLNPHSGFSHAPATIKSLLRKRYQLAGLPFFRRSAVEAVGGWDTEHKFAATYDLYLRLLGKRWVNVDATTLMWRRHDAQVSVTQKKKLHAAIEEARSRHLEREAEAGLVTS